MLERSVNPDEGDEEKRVEEKSEEEKGAVEEKPSVEANAREEEKAVDEKPPVEKKEKIATSKRKKIRKLSLEEVEEALKSVESTMGGLDSKYAQHLLRRKDELVRGLK